MHVRKTKSRSQVRKPGLPNYLLFAVEAEARPMRGDLIGVLASSSEGWEQGLILPLAQDGLEDPTPTWFRWLRNLFNGACLVEVADVVDGTMSAIVDNCATSEVVWPFPNLVFPRTASLMH